MERRTRNLTTEEKRIIINIVDAGWSSLEARRAHNPKVTGSNPVPATLKSITNGQCFLFLCNRKLLRNIPITQKALR